MLGRIFGTRASKAYFSFSSLSTHIMFVIVSVISLNFTNVGALVSSVSVTLFGSSFGDVFVTPLMISSMYITLVV